MQKLSEPCVVYLQPAAHVLVPSHSCASKLATLQAGWPRCLQVGALAAASRGALSALPSAALVLPSQVGAAAALQELPPASLLRL
jgi:hypothetical protein